jgi:hypothetical protein
MEQKIIIFQWVEDMPKCEKHRAGQCHSGDCLICPVRSKNMKSGIVTKIINIPKCL